VFGEFVSEAAALTEKEDKIHGFFDLVDSLGPDALMLDSRSCFGSVSRGIMNVFCTGISSPVFRE
jgi:hypothetical protein